MTAAVTIFSTLKRLAVAAALLAAVAACGGGQTTSSSSSSTPTVSHSPAAGSNAHDACAAVPQAQVASASGFTIITSSSSSVTGGTSPADLCTYATTAGGLSVDRFGSGVSFDSVAQVQFASSSPQPVSGVGDRAEFSFGTTGGNPDAELLAQKGSKLVLVIINASGITAATGQQKCAAVANLELAA